MMESDPLISALLFPALRGRVVAFPRLDPARAFGRVLALPERRAGLQVIHDEFASGESIAAVRARHADQHDAIAGLERADAMDHEGVDEVPARMGLGADILQR